jgi:hypothetical protein
MVNRGFALILAALGIHWGFWNSSFVDKWELLIFSLLIINLLCDVHSTNSPLKFPLAVLSLSLSLSLPPLSYCLKTFLNRSNKHTFLGAV